jgi:tetratricopeptide (TPR) repeat protein
VKEGSREEIGQLLRGLVAAEKEHADNKLTELLSRFEKVVSELPADLPLLVDLLDAIPLRSLALTQATLIVHLRVLSLMRTDDLSARASGLMALSLLHEMVREPDKAIAAAEEAADIWRELASADADQYRPQLAETLSILERWLTESREMEKAITVTGEAAKVHLDLAAVNPDGYHSYLADSRSHLASILQGAGAGDQALTVTKKAVDIYRELVAADAVGFRPHAAESLAHMTSHLLMSGHREDAATVAEEALQIYQELIIDGSAEYRPDPFSLAILGDSLCDLGRTREALPISQRAVKIYRGLAADDPNRYGALLTISLVSLARALENLGRTAEPEDAHRLVLRAVEIYRELAGGDPGEYRADLARSLAHLAWISAVSKQREEGLSAAAEAARIYQDLPVGDAGGEQPDPYSLLLLGSAFAGLEHEGDALPVLEKTVEICRRLVAGGPDYRDVWATSLERLAAVLRRLRSEAEPDEARRLTLRAVGIYRELAAHGSSRHRGELAAFLIETAGTVAESGNWEQGMSMAAEAAQIYQDLAVGDASEDQQDPYSLLRLGSSFVVLRSEGGEPPTLEKMAGIYQEIPAVIAVPLACRPASGTRMAQGGTPA